MRRCATFFLATTAIVVASPARADDTVYTVKKGDTCAAIAARFYGDARLVDLIHDANPGMGPAPHNLAEGRKLRLPPKPGAKVSSPDARITALRNKVEVQAPEPKPAKMEDPLFKGNRVGTKESSAADLLFRDESQLRLGEHTLVVILGDVQSRAAKVGEASLVTGSLRARLGELAGKKEIDVPTGKVSFGRGEAQVSVDDKKSARLAVYKGTSAITSQSKTVPVPENFGSKAEMGKPPTPPKPLPGAPAWKAAPPSLTFLHNGKANVAGEYAPSGSVAVSAYRVQLAYDADFSDIVVDAKVPAAVTRLETKAEQPANYFVRVSAIDDDSFEGPFSAVYAVRVVRSPVTKAPGYKVGVGLVADATCTVDGAALTEAMSFSSLIPHRLECALADKRGSAVLEVEAVHPALRLYAGRVQLATDAAGPENREGDVRVLLLDDHNERVPSPNATFETDDADVGVTILRTTPDPSSAGAYLVRLRWTENAKRVRLFARVAGGRPTPTAILPLPPAPKAGKAAKEAPSIELDLGVGTQVTSSSLADASGRFFGGVGARVPMDGGYLAFGGRIGYEGYLERKAVFSQLGGQEATFTHGALAVGTPLAFRFGSRDTKLSPYVGLLPELLLQESTFVLSSGESRKGNAVVFGLTGMFGVSYKLGPGSVFAELGYRGTTMSEFQVAGLGMKGGTFGLGYRFVLGSARQ